MSSVIHGQIVFFKAVTHTASTNSTGKRVNKFRTCTLHTDVTAASGSSPTLDVFPEVSHNNNTWARVVQPPDITEEVQCQRLTAAGDEGVSFDLRGARFMRIASVITGSSPSFTYSVVADYSD